jgi:soluble lytic murein transglycosylase-like protein
MRLPWLAPWIVLLVGTGAPAGPASAQSQDASDVEDYVQRVAQRMADEVPPAATQRRMRAYERYIQYFSQLSFSRARVTVNTNFVRALIAAESSARPKAVSPDGAIGLMQILPETGRRAARALYASERTFRYVRRARLRSVEARDLKDPAINILIGCYLLDRYNKEFQNNLAHTVGAWNAGPHRVRQYRRTPPYTETLELIGRVNAYYLYFRRTYRP